MAFCTSVFISGLGIIFLIFFLSDNNITGSKLKPFIKEFLHIHLQKLHDSHIPDSLNVNEGREN